ncbi:MAG: hypothetical protein IJT30_01740 [Muribaculaceae bacterium]|nr:hypothetical protein [Muribaculaceae bacterium]
MRRFLVRTIAAIVSFVSIVVLLAVAVPPDENGYLWVYNRKLALLDTVPPPRIILVGGSNLAFGIDSHRIQDSLHCRMVNMGLHGGIGIRLALEDVEARLHEGDLVVVAMEYGNFFGGGNGEPETLPALMAATGWRDMGRLNARQWQNVVAGIPRLAAANAKRLLRAALGGGLDTPSSSVSYRYVAAGFNDLGDEVSHWTLPPGSVEPSRPFTPRGIDADFMHWLETALHACRQRGATVVMLPPICPRQHFGCTYAPAIAQSLDSIGYPFAASPLALTVPDSCAYNGGYHVSRQGVDIATARIIALLRNRSSREAANREATPLPQLHEQP